MARGRRKTRVGSVVSDRMDKTIVVSVERRFAHPLYGKQVTRHKRYYAQDDENVAREGDIVRIAETKPLSRKKRWRLIQVIRKSEYLGLAQHDLEQSENDPAGIDRTGH